MPGVRQSEFVHWVLGDAHALAFKSEQLFK